MLHSVKFVIWISDSYIYVNSAAMQKILSKGNVISLWHYLIK